MVSHPLPHEMTTTLQFCLEARRLWTVVSPKESSNLGTCSQHLPHHSCMDNFETRCLRVKFSENDECLGVSRKWDKFLLVVSHVFAKEPKLFRKLAVNINEERLTNNNGDATDAGRVKQTV